MNNVPADLLSIHRFVNDEYFVNPETAQLAVRAATAGVGSVCMKVNGGTENRMMARFLILKTLHRDLVTSSNNM